MRKNLKNALSCLFLIPVTLFLLVFFNVAFAEEVNETDAQVTIEPTPVEDVSAPKPVIETTVSETVSVTPETAEPAITEPETDVVNAETITAAPEMTESVETNIPTTETDIATPETEPISETDVEISETIITTTEEVKPIVTEIETNESETEINIEITESNDPATETDISTPETTETMSEADLSVSETENEISENDEKTSEETQQVVTGPETDTPAESDVTISIPEQIGQQTEKTLNINDRTSARNKLEEIRNQRILEQKERLEKAMQKYADQLSDLGDPKTIARRLAKTNNTERLSSVITKLEGNLPNEVFNLLNQNKKTNILNALGNERDKLGKILNVNVANIPLDPNKVVIGASTEKIITEALKIGGDWYNPTQKNLRSDIKWAEEQIEAEKIFVDVEKESNRVKGDLSRYYINIKNYLNRGTAYRNRNKTVITQPYANVITLEELQQTTPDSPINNTPNDQLMEIKLYSNPLASPEKENINITEIINDSVENNETIRMKNNTANVYWNNMPFETYNAYNSILDSYKNTDSSDKTPAEIYAEIFKSQIPQIESMTEEEIKETYSMIIGAAPGIGDAYDLAVGISGVDPITNKQLGITERAASISAGYMPLINRGMLNKITPKDEAIENALGEGIQMLSSAYGEQVDNVLTDTTKTISDTVQNISNQIDNAVNSTYNNLAKYTTNQSKAEANNSSSSSKSSNNKSSSSSSSSKSSSSNSSSNKSSSSSNSSSSKSSSVSNTASSAVSSAAKTVSKTVSSATKTVNSTVKSVSSAVSSATSSAVKTVSKTVNSVSSAANSVIKSVSSFLGF